MRAPDRKEQILVSARRLFATSGFDDATVDDISAAAGITKPIIYRHFGSKRELHLAVLEEHLADLIKRLWVALSSAQDPRNRLRNGLVAYFAFVEERPDGFRMLLEAGTAKDPKTQAKLGSAWETLAEGVARTVGDLLRGAGLDPAGAPIYARALIGMAQSVADWWLQTQRVPPESLVDYLLALVWRGFDGLPRDPTHRSSPHLSK